MLGSLWFSCEGALASEISQKPNQRKSIKAVFLWFILHSYSRGACVNLSANLLAMPLLMSVPVHFFFPPMLLSLTPLTRHCPLAAMPLCLLPSSPRWRPSATRVRLLLWTNGTSPSAFCTGSRPSAGQPATTRPDLPSWPLELWPRVCMQPHYHRLGLQGRQPGRPRRQLAPRHRPCSRPSALPWAPSPGAASS